MVFELSEEQQLLHESIVRYIEREYVFEKRRASILDDDAEFSRRHWRQFAELGWLAAFFDEAEGGLGGTPADTVLVMEQVGRGLLLEPFLPSLVLAGGAIRRAGATRQKSELLNRIISGGSTAAWVHNDDNASPAPQASVETTPQGYAINGNVQMVAGGHDADILVVTAKTAVGNSGIYLVPPGLAGVMKEATSTVDNLPCANIRFDNVQIDSASELTQGTEAADIIERVLSEAVLAVSAEAVGCMESLCNMTIEYTKTREQFGTAIANFQALQHRMADMFIACEKSKSLLFFAAEKLTHNYDPATRRVLSALKAQVAQAGRFVAHSAVQLHGGMGMTDELAVSHYFKRLAVIEQSFGSLDWHLGLMGAAALDAQDC